MNAAAVVAQHAVTAAAVQAAVPQKTVNVVKVREKESIVLLLEHQYFVFHFSDDEGDSDYYQKKETDLEMGERGRLVADNGIQQQEN